MALFDDVLSQLAGEMEAAVRAELSQRMAGAEAPPRGLIGTLARDHMIEVAAPVLAASPALTEDDLLSVARTRGQDYLRAISQRPQISEAISEAIVERGDDTTLQTLLANEGAQMSRETHELVVDRAVENPALHAAVVQRASLPIDLLNEMYFVVEARLRDDIMKRNAEVDPADLEHALAAGRKQMAARDGALPADYDQAEKAIRTMRLRGAITPPVLAGFLRNRETTKFLVALSELAEIDFHTAGASSSAANSTRCPSSARRRLRALALPHLRRTDPRPRRQRHGPRPRIRRALRSPAREAASAPSASGACADRPGTWRRPRAGWLLSKPESGSTPLNVEHDSTIRRFRLIASCSRV